MRGRMRLFGEIVLATFVTLMAMAVFAPADAWARDYKTAGYYVWDGSWQWRTAYAEVLDDIDSDHYTLNSSWYVMTDDWGDKDRPTISGTVNIILEDGCDVHLKNGIHVPPGSTLNIYGQRSNTGKFKVAKSEADTAAIGGNREQDSGTINIYGGDINVHGGSYSNHGGAGIGGGYKGAGVVRIYGGYILAEGGNEGAGIGGGSNKDGANGYGGDYNDIEIWGGSINAIGYWGAGIGGGMYARGGNIKIVGGNITATGGKNAAGIGGGFQKDGGNITIHNGAVTAKGGSVTSNGGAGIGGGGKGASGTINILGGTVNASGGVFAAGIGGGDEGEGNGITISGGNVTATGHTQDSNGGGGAAGIGGGDKAAGKNITISSGIINATGGTKLSVKGGAGIGGGSNANGENIIIRGSTIIQKAQGGTDAAGIGGGDLGEGKNIRIEGGIITANGGSVKDGGGAGIGGGQKKSGEVTITGAQVNATGGGDGAGIGGGEDGSANVRISGGDVRANGGANAAGIGGGQDASGGNITIDGGAVRAIGGKFGAGIGSGEDGADAGTINISGGNVTAQGGEYGAGIGGGDHGGRSGSVNINGGLVNATGGLRGAGIGSGRWSHLHGNQYYANPVSVTIKGNASVSTTGGKSAAGIGGGYMGASGRIEIGVLGQGGPTVNATGGINGGPGIGSGCACFHDEITTVDVIINSGRITARGGAIDNSSNNIQADPGPAIGTGGTAQSASVGGAAYESYFVGHIWLNGGTIAAYTSDITKSLTTNKETLNALGTTDKDHRDWYSKGFVHFAGATVDMYPGAGSANGTVKQMVRASETNAGGVRLEDTDTKYQRVSYITQNENVNSEMKESKTAYRTLVLTGAEDIEEYGGTKLEHAEYKHIRVESVHRHNFTYSVGTTNTAEDTIIAKCSGGEGCELHNNEARVILTKPPHEVYGDGKDAGVVVSDENHIADAKVAYYLANPDGSKASAIDDSNLYEIPTDAGHYWAELTIDGEDDESAAAGTNKATAHVVYTIAKATPSVANTAVIDESNQPATIDLSAYVKNAQEYVAYALDDADGSLAAKGIVMEGSVLRIPGATSFDTNPNSVIVHVNAAADANHEAVNASITVTINKLPRPTITPDEVTLRYGDQGKGINAQVTGDETNPTGEISYAVKSTASEDDPFAPTTPGTDPATVDSEWSENDVIRVNKTTGAIQTKKVGVATVVVTVAGTDHYAPTSKEVQVTVQGKLFTGISSAGYEGEYDGIYHDIKVVGVPEDIGAKVYYATTELTDQNYQINGTTADDLDYYDIAAFRNAGEHTVYYYVAATNYEAVKGSEDVKIAKKPVEASVYVEDKTYDGLTSATPHVSVNSSDLIEGDSIDISGVTAVFTDKDAGEDKQVVLDTSSVVFSGEGEENYDVTIPTSATATIDKAWAVVIAEDQYVPVHESLPELTAHVNAPVLWEDIEYELSCDADMDVSGPYEIVATADPEKEANKNYEIVCTDGTLYVTAPIQVTAKGFDGPYDGQPHGITVDVKNPGIPSLDPSAIDRLSHEDWLGIALWAQYAGLDVVVPEDDWTDDEWAAWIVWAKSELKTAIENFKLAEVYYGSEEITADNYKYAVSETSPTFSDVSTNTVYYYVVSFDGQEFAGSCDVVINKADPVVTAPKAAEGLRYNGEPQTLVIPGSTEDGTIEYSLDGVEWSTEPPTKTEVGSYAVLYRVIGDSNHKDVAPTPIIATIAKALEPGVTLESWTYGSPAKTPVFSDGENPITTGVTFSYKVTGADDSTYSSDAPTQAGNYTVRAVVAASGTLYDGTYYADFSVVPKPINATVVAEDKDYDGTTSATCVAYIDETQVLPGDNVTIGVVNGQFADANAGTTKEVLVDKSSIVVSGIGSQNYEVVFPETCIAAIHKVAAFIGVDDVTVALGQPVPEPFKSLVYVPVKGDDLVYTLYCDYEQKVGEYDILIDFDENVVPNCNYDIYWNPGKLTITEADLTVSAEGYTGTYDGQAHGISVTALPETAGAKVYYSAERDLTPDTAQIAGTLVNPTFTDAGTYRVYYCVIASGYDSVIGFEDVVIAKADVSFTAPAVGQLTYTGASQALVQPGSAEGGTMEYSLDGTNWSTDVPVATEPGAYAVLYRVTGDANHNDVSPKGFASTIAQKAPETPKAVEMYRLYNPNSGEHFYTASTVERGNLISKGWKYEGVGWRAPKQGAPVYRLYNPYVGDHHYTMSAQERDMLVRAGWTSEGVGWNSAGDNGVPLWRQYNPNARVGTHNYTVNSRERDNLVSLGWVHEGIGWYGLK